MNFFQLLNCLFYNKKALTDSNLDSDSLQGFVPYMVNRWLSFYDRSKAVFVNETLNKYSYLFDDKNEMFKLYFNLIPQTRFKKIQYVKKKKEDKEKEAQGLDVIARNNCISIREVKQYMDIFETKSK